MVIDHNCNENSAAIDGGNCWAAPCGLTAGNAVVYTVYTQTCVLLSKHRVYAGIYIQLLEKHDMNAPSTDISLIGRISKARLAVSSSVTAGLLPQAFVFCPCSKHIYLYVIVFVGLSLLYCVCLQFMHCTAASLRFCGHGPSRSHQG